MSLPTYFLSDMDGFLPTLSLASFYSAVVFRSSSFGGSGSPVKLQQHGSSWEHPGFSILNAGDETLN